MIQGRPFTQDIRDYAASLGVTAAEAIRKGREEKSKEIVEAGAELAKRRSRLGPLSSPAECGRGRLRVSRSSRGIVVGHSRPGEVGRGSL